MPRYFFHRADGVREPDTEGTVLDNLDAARMEAVMYAGETLKEQPKIVWDGHDMHIEVSDETGTILFMVMVSTVNAPAVSNWAGSV